MLKKILNYKADVVVLSNVLEHIISRKDFLKILENQLMQKKFLIRVTYV